MKRRRILVTVFIAHFLLIALVCLRELLLIIGEENTVWPQAWRAVPDKIGLALSLSSTFSPHHPVRQVFGTYLNAAGIENGYGYFAPAVPNPYKIVFELHYPDGHVDYQLPRVASYASGLRVTSLIDYLSRVHDDGVRALIVKMVTYSVWRENPQATIIRSHFIRGELSSASDYQTKPSSYVVLHSYESRFRDQPGSDR